MDLWVLNFHLWAETGEFESRSHLIADDPHAFLRIDTVLVSSAFSELCFRMAEAGHGWNVTTFRLTNTGEMNIKFGINENPWDVDPRESYVD